MKKLYSFELDCGRMGSIDGLFVADETEIDNIVGKEIYFGEVLGKHSEIFETFDKEDFFVQTDDQDFIDKLLKIMGSTTISGFNPVEIHAWNDEDDENWGSLE